MSRVLSALKMGMNLRKRWRREKISRLGRTYASRALSKPLVKPRSVTLTLTTKCNLKCRMCSHWSLKPAVEMPLEDAKRFLNEIADWGVKTVDLSGGEPFMHKHIYDIIGYASEKGLDINITTNGMLLTKKGIERIMDSRVTRLQLSIDAPDAKTHDAIRGKKGSFEKIMRAVKALNKARESRKLKLNLTTVVQHDNFTKLADMVHFAGEHGFDSITFQPVNDDNLNIRRIDIRNPHRVPLNRVKELDKQIDALVRLKNKGAPIGNSEAYLESMKNYFRNEIRDAVKCYAGYVMAVVSPDGKLWSCMGEFADLAEIDIKSAWHSPRAEEKRKLIRRCRTPCLYPCYLEGDADSLFSAVRSTLL